MLPLSLYVHIPWCIKKCPYCDFNSHTAKTALPERNYIKCLLDDLASDIEHYNILRPLNSIFIGGGTPSLFSPDSIDQLLFGIRQQLAVKEDVEITLEANPGTFESQKFAEFRATGINRLSIGVQSFTDDLLAKLGRVHSAKEAERAAEIAHQSGFENFNIDLMYGIPGASLTSSIHDVKTAISLAPSHMSFYQMTLEPDTYFYKHPPKLPDDQQVYDIQRNCQALLAEAGYYQYEISAYSLPGRHCLHNLNYWQFGDYIGIGAGAHGKLSLNLPNQIMRSNKEKNPALYLSGRTRVGEKAVDCLELPLEFLMNQLRLPQGFRLPDYERATGLTVSGLLPVLAECVQEGLLIAAGNHYYCSQKGWDFLDTTLEKFVP